MDKFASRYGWDSEKILCLPARDFIGYYGAIKAAERKEFNEQLKAAAFTSWRFEMTLSNMLGGKAKVTYPDYCEAHGLLTEKEIKQNAAMKQLQKIQNKYIVEEATRRADEIMRIDKENRAKAKAQKEGG